MPGLGGATVTWVAALGKTRLVLGTSDGRTIPLDLKFDVTFKDGKRTVTAAPVFGEPAALDAKNRRPVRRLAAGGADAGGVTVAQVGPAELVILSVVEKKALIGGTRREESLDAFVPEMSGEITALKLDSRAEELFIGTSQGQVLRYDMKDAASPKLAEVVAVASKPGVPITVLGFLLGDRTLVAGDQAGGVSSWQVVPPPGGGEKRLTRTHEFTAHAAPVVAMTASKRDKGFATADGSGVVHLSYGTSGQTLLSFKAERPGLEALAFAPKTDALLAEDGQGVIALWQVDNPHPETTLKTLFGKVWYEGYSQPA